MVLFRRNRLYSRSHHDTFHLCTHYRTDGVTGMSHSISEGKQKKKMPIRIKEVEFVYSLKTKWWLNSHTNERFWFCQVLTLGPTCKFIPPPWYKGGGWTLPPLLQNFWYVAVFRNDFTFSGEAFDLLYKMKVYFIDGGAAGGLLRHQ